MKKEAIRIGEVNGAWRVSADTVRHYGRCALLKKAPRTAAGYRMYSTDKRRADSDNPIGVGRGFSQSPIGVDYDIVWDVATTKAGRLERDLETIPGLDASVTTWAQWPRWST